MEKDGKYSCGKNTRHIDMRYFSNHGQDIEEGGKNWVLTGRGDNNILL